MASQASNAESAAAQTFKAYILRTCAADMTSYGGFVWPSEGHVAAPDWRADDRCGHGLHGFLWGEGNGDLANWSPDAKWIVAGVNEWRDLDGKVKAPEAWVVHCGDRLSATDFIRSLGARGAIVGGTATAGYSGTATAGYSGTATAGDRGTATAGDSGTATAGYSGTATAGYSGTATAGDRGIIVGRFWDDKTNRWRLAIAYVGEAGIEPGVAYKVKDGSFVRADGK